MSEEVATFENWIEEQPRRPWDKGMASPGERPPNKTKEVSPHWYISYNTGDYRSYGCITTALVLGQGEHFLVLVGDHRKGFEDIMDDPQPFTLSRCLQYVRDHRDLLHKMSDALV